MMAPSGKAIVLGLVLLGVGAAGANVWYQHQLTRQAQRYWGTRSAQRFAQAPRVRLRRVAERRPRAIPDGHNESRRDAAGVDLADVSQAPGLAHLRHWLRQDASYDWDADPPKAKPPAAYGIEFADPDDPRDNVEILVDARCEYVWDSVGADPVRLSAKMRSGLATFLAEHAPPAPTAATVLSGGAAEPHVDGGLEPAARLPLPPDLLLP